MASDELLSGADEAQVEEAEQLHEDEDDEDALRREEAVNAARCPPPRSQAAIAGAPARSCDPIHPLAPEPRRKQLQPKEASSAESMELEDECEEVEEQLAATPIGSA